MCFKPLKIRLTKKEIIEGYPQLINSYHSGNYYPIKYREVACGTCIDCTKKYQRDWIFRLKQEAKISINQSFLTLTYRPESLTPENNYKDRLVLEKKHLQTFLKSVKRKQTRFLNKLQTFESLTWPRIKYYACGEYGGKYMRPHYHAIIFNLHPVIASQLKSVSYEYKHTDTWKYGNIDLEPLGDNAIIYATKYLGKEHKPDGILKKHNPFNLMSPNIGSSYLRPWTHKYHHAKNNKGYTLPVQDFKIPMSKYYKERLYSEALRPLLAEQSIKEYQERNENNAKILGLTLEQFEQRRQRIATRKYNKKKNNFILTDN